ncbi:hypothetical protein B0T24DRAFT_367287 [Lasiosphaeria ovina]|uniref:Uncharacterized protein n=1 Tax=Lasiosphaeria ovina TaxID=92902 RepID=A0AAE0JZ54_9PEZI|nr:hypothetical protein B0T24DRAFT_367287 [Lasiosphaeria ovina]
MCYFTTINPSADIRLNDAIRRDRVNENAILHFNERHKWYAIKYQSQDDLIVFRNADSLGKRARKFSFPTPPSLEVEMELGGEGTYNDTF